MIATSSYVDERLDFSSVRFLNNMHVLWGEEMVSFVQEQKEQQRSGGCISLSFCYVRKLCLHYDYSVKFIDSLYGFAL